MQVIDNATEEKMFSDIMSASIDEDALPIPRPYRISEEALRLIRAKEYAKGNEAVLRDNALDRFLEVASKEQSTMAYHLGRLEKKIISWKVAAIMLGLYGVLLTGYIASLLFFVKG